MIYAEALLWVVVVTYWLYRLVRLFKERGRALLFSQTLLLHLMMGVMWVGFGKSIMERLWLTIHS